MKNTSIDILCDDGVIIRLNQHLIKSQKLNQNDVERLKFLHQGKINLFAVAKANKNDKYILRMIAQMVELIEFELQRTWKFPMNKDYHKFWKLPGCECPVMDNEDRYPTGQYIISGCCPIHGQ